MVTRVSRKEGSFPERLNRARETCLEEYMGEGTPHDMPILRTSCRSSAARTPMARDYIEIITGSSVSVSASVTLNA